MPDHPSAHVRSRLVRTLRRDLVGPGPEDEDLARERLDENPSRWYLTGFIAPADDEPEANDILAQEELDTEAIDPAAAGAGGAAGDDEEPGAPAAHRRFLPSAIGLTVLLPVEIETIEAEASWGDYVTEPPLPSSVLLPEESGASPEDEAATKPEPLPKVDWVRLPQTRMVSLPIVDGRCRVVVPESAAAQLLSAGAGRGRGGLELTVHAQRFDFTTPGGAMEHVRAVTVVLVNRRPAAAKRYADVAYAFQARLELVCPEGFRPRYDLSAYRSADEDQRIADLHYRDVEEYGVGRNAAAAWSPDPDGEVRRVHTDPLPQAEVERVAPNEEIADVAFGMEALAALAAEDGDALAAKLAPLPTFYGAWIEGERRKFADLAERRRETAERLVAGMRLA